MASRKPGNQLGIFEGRYTYDEIRVGSKTGESLMAFDEATLEFVVIKRPSPTQPNPDLRRASIADLEREERVLGAPALKDHPAVCRLLRTGQATGWGGAYRYLVLARARGTPVPALIQRYHEQGQPFPQRLYLDIAQQLLQLLATAHGAGIIYNDVKAEHLYWDEKARRLSVIDWGNAQFAAESLSFTPADDVFQCGELLYEFVAGARYSPVSLLDWQRAGEKDWAVPFFQAIEPDLSRLISKALHPEPRRRFAGAAAMGRELDAYLSKRERETQQELTALPLPGRAGDGETLKKAEVDQAAAQLLADSARPVSPYNRLLELVGEYSSRPLLRSLLGKARRIVDEADLPAREQLTAALSAVAVPLRRAIRDKWDSYFRQLASLQRFLTVVDERADSTEAAALEATANYYGQLAGELAGWRRDIEQATPADLAVESLRQLPSILGQAGETAAEIAARLHDAERALTAEDGRSFEAHIAAARQLDPHNAPLAELKHNLIRVAEIPPYTDWLPEEIGPAGFGAWLERALAAFDRISEAGAANAPLASERQKVEQLAQQWSLVTAAASQPDLRKLRSALARLSQRVVGGDPSPRLAEAVKRLARIADESAWRFLDDGDFAAQCDRLSEELTHGSGDLAQLQRLWAATLEQAETTAQRLWAEYFRELGRSAAALAAGQIDDAVEHLRQGSYSPVRDRLWDELNALIRAAQAIASGDEAEARRAYEALSGRLGPGGRERPLAVLCATSLEALPQLRSALQQFVRDPGSVAPTLAGLPVLLQSGAVGAALSCARAVTGGLDCSRQGQFPAAAEAFSQALAAAEQLPRYLDVDLASAAGVVATYLDGVRRCERHLIGILDHIGGQATVAGAWRASSVRERLSAIVQQMPRPQGGRQSEGSRPAVWLEVFDEAAALAEAGRSAEIEALLSRRGIGKDEPISVYALFHFIAAGSTPLVRRPTADNTRRRRTSRDRAARIRYPRWALPAFAVAAIVVGVGVAAVATRTAPGLPPPHVAASLAPMPAATADPTPSSPTPPPAANAVSQACAKIAAAEAEGRWQETIDLVGAMGGTTTCGDRPLPQIAAQAWYQMGLAKYHIGDYTTAVQDWQSALRLRPSSELPVDLLIACATARAGNDAALYLKLASEFAVAEIQAQCGFDPAAYLVQSVDVLSLLSEANQSYYMPCGGASCPGLYQDPGGQWHLATFFENNLLKLPLAGALQSPLSGGSRPPRLRALDLEFLIASQQPNSFPYGSVVGLEVSSLAGGTVRLLLASEPELSAGAAVVDASRPNDSACQVDAAGPFPIVSRDRARVPHLVSMRWEAGGGLQFLIDSRPVCQDPIPFPDPPEAALYLAGRGVNLIVQRLVLGLDQP